MKYEVLVGMKSLGTYHSFKEAAQKFLEAIFETIKEGTSLQMLETTNFISMQNDDDSYVGVMDFYGVRDFSYQFGLLSDSNINPDAGEPSVALVTEAFNKAKIDMIKGQMEELVSMFKMLSRVMA